MSRHSRGYIYRGQVTIDFELESFDGNSTIEDLEDRVRDHFFTGARPAVVVAPRATSLVDTSDEVCYVTAWHVEKLVVNLHRAKGESR